MIWKNTVFRREKRRPNTYVWPHSVEIIRTTMRLKQGRTISLARARRIALAVLRRRDLTHEARLWARDDEEHNGDVYVPGPVFDLVARVLALGPHRA